MRGVLVTRVAFAVEGTPKGGVEKGLNNGVVQGRWVFEVAVWEERAAITDAGKD